ncbi:MAG: magnesium transporter CorA family protein [Thermodesulfobacteriota bacterium]
MIEAKVFDFNNKSDFSIELSELPNQIQAGNYCWVTADPLDTREILSILEIENLSNPALLNFLSFKKCEGKYEVFPRCLQFTVTEARISDSRIKTSQVDVALTANCMIMIVHEPALFLYKMKATNQEDFAKFSLSPSFLLYEIGDFMLDVYGDTLRDLSSEIEKIQINLFGRVDDNIFKQVSNLTSDLLHFRRVVLAARDLMHELATRRSPFVSESTQPFLDRLADRLERLCEDISAEREALNEMLHLYMGMVSHRTNRIVNRLTALSMVFLPLGFFCGVFGMNFEFMPELGLKYGYLGFWLIILSIASGLLVFMKRKGWI